MKRVLLGLGSNRNFNGKSSLELLVYACHDLSSFITEIKFSSVYKTKAMYVENQNDFYNMAVSGFVPDETDPYTFLEQIHKIEAEYGRDREKEIRFGPRSIDIDIELFGDSFINDEILQIPHIRMEERAFVLIPALEILTDSADELMREKYSNCLAKLQKEGGADGIEKIQDYSEVVENGTIRKHN